MPMSCKAAAAAVNRPRTPADVRLPKKPRTNMATTKAAANAAKLGQTFAEANRGTKASGAIRQLADRVIGTSDEESAGDEPAKKSLLGGFDFKSLLAKKDKPSAKVDA